jgi:DnaJ-class molecular chaperone
VDLYNALAFYAKVRNIANTQLTRITQIADSNPMESQDYYQLLGVASDATPQQIKDAYRALAFRYHPDRNAADPERVERMKAINEAYAVLSNPQKRSTYDALRNRYGAEAQSQFRQSYSEQDIFRDSDIQKIFEEMARAFGVRGFEDVFKEFYGQGFKHFEYRRPGMFAGGFFFFGPFGKRHGQRKIPREGVGPQQLGGIGKVAKFLIEKISGVALPAKGADIHDSIRLSPEHARSGGPYAYYLQQSEKKLVVKIPAGVRDGQQIRLPGMGQEGQGGAPAGDLYLKVKIKQPILNKLKKLIKN